MAFLCGVKRQFFGLLGRLLRANSNPGIYVKFLIGPLFGLLCGIEGYLNIFAARGRFRRNGECLFKACFL